jgi:hypothetical protein
LLYAQYFFAKSSIKSLFVSKILFCFNKTEVSTVIASKVLSSFNNSVKSKSLHFSQSFSFNISFLKLSIFVIIHKLIAFLKEICGKCSNISVFFSSYDKYLHLIKVSKKFISVILKLTVLDL